jgi:dTDP-glucose 4,6-dehydratase
MNNKVLVTGAGGFIGSHLVELLVERGFSVKAFVRYNSKNNWGWLEESPYRKEIEVVSGDVRDYDSVRAALDGCDTVYHLAALIGIPYSYVSPLAYIRVNIEGTYNVLQASRERSVSKVLVTSTSEVYGTAQYVPIDENHPRVGQSPYSASKIGADEIALSFYRSFGLPVRIVRPFNTYGPRQSARAIIPTIITQILNGQNTLHLGNLLPTRDLTFVKDTVRGFLAIAQQEAFNGTVTNIGMNDEISVGDLVGMISRIMDVQVTAQTAEERLRPDRSEVERLRCENKKLCSGSDWKPEYDLEKGLKETIEWLKKHTSYYKPDIYNV